MAKAIEIRPRPTPPAEEVQRKLDAAPREHAEAVLDAYRTLQTLHDTDTLSFVRGLLGAGDEVLAHVVSVATSPQSTRAIRNLLVLTDLLGQVNPDAVHRAAAGMTPLLTSPSPVPAPSLPAIMWRLATSKDVHRALGFGVAVLACIGAAIGPENIKSAER